MTDNIEILADMLEKRPGLTTRQIANRLLMEVQATLQALRYWGELGRVYHDESKPFRWFLSSKFVFEKALNEALESPRPPKFVESYAAGRAMGLTVEDAWAIAKRELTVQPKVGATA